MGGVVYLHRDAHSCLVTWHKRLASLRAPVDANLCAPSERDPMPSKHESALTSVRALLGFVAALGITNTLHQLVTINPDLSHTRLRFPWTPESVLQQWYDPFFLAISQIIIALRFYQSSTITLEHYQDRQGDYSICALEVITEGILVAASSFYIHFTVDFVSLFTILFLCNGGFNLFSSLTDYLRKWAWANIGLGVALLALLRVYVPISYWIYGLIVATAIIVASNIGTPKLQKWTWLPVGSGILDLVVLLFVIHKNVITDRSFFWLAAVGIAINTVGVARVYWREYFP